MPVRAGGGFYRKLARLIQAPQNNPAPDRSWRGWFLAGLNSGQGWRGILPEIGLADSSAQPARVILFQQPLPMLGIGPPPTQPVLRQPHADHLKPRFVSGCFHPPSLSRIFTPYRRSPPERLPGAQRPPRGRPPNAYRKRPASIKAGGGVLREIGPSNSSAQILRIAIMSPNQRQHPIASTTTGCFTGNWPV